MNDSNDKKPPESEVDEQRSDADEAESRRRHDLEADAGVVRPNTTRGSPDDRPERAKRRATGSAGAPGWVVPSYMAGLVLIFAGQRALTALESGATMLTAAGALLGADGHLGEVLAQVRRGG